ncbi:MAG: ComEA family DNA-binding protein [Candidatus Binatia bacterium]
MSRPNVRTLLGVLAALAVFIARPVAAESSPVNINTASVTELAGLKGIGPAKAQAIIEHRDKNGEFKSIDDLKLVRGIGDKMLEELRPQVTVQSKSAAAAPAAAPKP